MGNKLVGRHGLHIYPFEPAEMILDPQSFFKQATKFDRPQVIEFLELFDERPLTRIVARETIGRENYDGIEFAA